MIFSRGKEKFKVEILKMHGIKLKSHKNINASYFVICYYYIYQIRCMTRILYTWHG